MVLNTSSPVINSNGGAETVTISVAENSTAVTTIVATDEDGDTPTYSITGGVDAASFSIVGATGALTFASAPDYESTTDSDSDNFYVVEITANDGRGGTDIQTITAMVTDVDETPPIPDDGDNVSLYNERRVPSLSDDPNSTLIGDGNGDGIMDYLQGNVSSTPFRLTNRISENPDAVEIYVSLVADSDEGQIDTDDANSAFVMEFNQLDAPDVLPAGLHLPLGMLSFTADVENAGETETFSLYVDGDFAIDGYWKLDGNGNVINF